MTAGAPPVAACFQCGLWHEHQLQTYLHGCRSTQCSCPRWATTPWTFQRLTCLFRSPAMQGPAGKKHSAWGASSEPRRPRLVSPCCIASVSWCTHVTLVINMMSAQRMPQVHLTCCRWCKPCRNRAFNMYSLVPLQLPPRAM